MLKGFKIPFLNKAEKERIKEEEARIKEEEEEEEAWIKEEEARIKKKEARIKKKEEARIQEDYENLIKNMKIIFKQKEKLHILNKLQEFWKKSEKQNSDIDVLLSGNFVIELDNGDKYKISYYDVNGIIYTVTKSSIIKESGTHLTLIGITPLMVENKRQIDYEGIKRILTKLVAQYETINVLKILEISEISKYDMIKLLELLKKYNFIEENGELSLLKFIELEKLFELEKNDVLKDITINDKIFLIKQLFDRYTYTCIIRNISEQNEWAIQLGGRKGKSQRKKNNKKIKKRISRKINKKYKYRS